MDTLEKTIEIEIEPHIPRYKQLNNVAEQLKQAIKQCAKDWNCPTQCIIARYMHKTIPSAHPTMVLSYALTRETTKRVP
jgi:hypothetical protein